MTAVAGIVLAAGPSSRLDGETTKQLLRFDGEPLVRRAARTALASRLRRILVVVGHESATVSAVLAGLAIEVVDNVHWREGQSTSVKAGLSRLGPEVDAAMFLPVDQPLLTAATIDRLIGRFVESGRRVVVPTHREERRAPVLIARPLFARLARIDGDSGARQIFGELDRDEIVEVEVADERELADIDTVGDLTRLRALP